MKRLKILCGVVVLTLADLAGAQSWQILGEAYPGDPVVLASLGRGSTGMLEPRLLTAATLSPVETLTPARCLRLEGSGLELEQDRCQPLVRLNSLQPQPLLLSFDWPKAKGVGGGANLPRVRLADGGESSSQGNPTGMRPVTVSGEVPAERVQWSSLFKHEFIFLSVMHSFRVVTEPGTLQGIEKSTFGGYFKAVGALHGWSDGDTYYETYLGHPIQGAVSGYMWVHHDPKFRMVEFGKSRAYWMSRLRAYAWSFAEIEQFKVGMLSEATIGQIDRYCCAYGFNDHIITNNGGLVWIVGGDAIDRYVVRKIEDHTTSVPLRVIARVGLNPPLGMANLMDLNYPWHRENRPGVREYRGESYVVPDSERPPVQTSIVPKFEMAAAVPELMRFGNLSCWGGGGVAGFRMTERWQWTLEVSGCTLGESLPKNWSGDQLSWTMGPQWIRHSESRWSPHAHFRVGGQKITEKQVDPQILSWVGGPPPLTDGENSEGQKHWETTGLSMSMGGGLDMRLTRAFAWRFANFDYVRSWLGQLNGVNFDHGFRFTTGVVLRVGTW